MNRSLHDFISPLGISLLLPSYLTIDLSRIRAVSFAIRARKAYPSNTPLSVREYEFIEANDGDLENRERPTRPVGRSTRPFLRSDGRWIRKKIFFLRYIIAKTFSTFFFQLRAFYPNLQKFIVDFTYTCITFSPMLRLKERSRFNGNFLIFLTRRTYKSIVGTFAEYECSAR